MILWTHVTLHNMSHGAGTEAPGEGPHLTAHLLQASIKLPCCDVPPTQWWICLHWAPRLLCCLWGSLWLSCLPVYRRVLWPSPNSTTKVAVRAKPRNQCSCGYSQLLWFRQSSLSRSKRLHSGPIRPGFGWRHAESLFNLTDDVTRGFRLLPLSTDSRYHLLQTLHGTLPVKPNTYEMDEDDELNKF